MTWWTIKKALRLSTLSFRLSLGLILWALAAWVKMKSR